MYILRHSSQTGDFDNERRDGLSPVQIKITVFQYVFQDNPAGNEFDRPRLSNHAAEPIQIRFRICMLVLTRQLCVINFIIVNINDKYDGGSLRARRAQIVRGSAGYALALILGLNHTFITSACIEGFPILRFMRGVALAPELLVHLIAHKSRWFFGYCLY